MTFYVNNCVYIVIYISYLRSIAFFFNFKIESKRKYETIWKLREKKEFYFFSGLDIFLILDGFKKQFPIE